jgi:NADH-quinone oxidoreductase subunit G
MGIDIPHYCWHPGLSVAANCRMCLVELAPPPGQRPLMLDILSWDKDKNDYVVIRKPKLQPACQMSVVENMEVKSESSAEVAQARSQVQEFLLLNHPVDCPICDQAGGACGLLARAPRHQARMPRAGAQAKGVVFGRPSSTTPSAASSAALRRPRDRQRPWLDERQRP